MLSKIHNIKLSIGFLFVIILMFVGIGIVRPADHGDTPLLKQISRSDARLTDLFAFLRGNNLVLVLCTDPAIPPTIQKYIFPSDITFQIFIDNDSEVRFDEPDDLLNLGGTVVEPDRIREDITFKITVKDGAPPKLSVSGLSGNAEKHISLFTGLRDDPFIRAPRTGRNIAAIVIELPLSLVLDSQETLLIWGTSKVEDLMGSQHDLAGLALRSQFPENDQMNTLRPRDHFAQLGVAPDVIRFDTSFFAAFPNGRDLPNDVVSLLCSDRGDCRVEDSDGPSFPTENDVPFLSVFPYLAPPHQP